MHAIEFANDGVASRQCSHRNGENVRLERTGEQLFDIILQAALEYGICLFSCISNIDRIIPSHV